MKSKILLFFPLLFASLQAADERDLTITPNEAETECSVSDCLTTASGSLDIPSTYNDLPVTSIGNAAFRDCTSLTYVTIPDSVTSIGTAVFEGCISLDSITIPDGVTNIGYMAFYNCTSLSSVVIPDGVTRIEGLAFAVCTNLTNIIIPDSVIYLGYRAFGRCTSLENITIPASVTTIDGRAFHHCTSLNSVVFEGNAPTFGTEVFEGSDSVTIYYDSSNSGWSSTVAGRPADQTNTLTYAINGDGTEYSVSDCLETAQGL